MRCLACGNFCGAKYCAECISTGQAEYDRLDRSGDARKVCYALTLY